MNDYGYETPRLTRLGQAVVNVLCCGAISVTGFLLCATWYDF